MALFSRGKRNRDQSADTDAERPAEPAPAESPAAGQAESGTAQTPEASLPSGAAEGTDAAAEASVGISVSSFRGVGAAPVEEAPAPVRAAAPPNAPLGELRLGREVAPPPRESVPGLRDNVLLAEALGALPADPSPQQILDVARQLMQGHLYLRVKGDARTLLAEGKGLPLAIVTLGDENFVVAYSGGFALSASLRSDGANDTSAMGQPALTVIRHVLGGSYAGLVLDPASAPARIVLRRDMLERMVEGIDPDLEIKALLASERTPATAPSVGAALGRAPFWVGVSRAGDSGKFGVAEARTADGQRFIEIFSHPLEVVVLGRGDQPAPMTGEQLGKALRADPGITGVIVDPAGPWIRLTREDLAGLIDA
ncbi:SseB family protein [Microbacterium sp. 4R-513]|uniref:SseB family protein n=1 Tax=Microbacterium sp. 4R-513 TaxID=2567934 RepID=UPI0013E127BD|nr:SseB family protein [Microbacterium sp. 4R-513]QIG38478.1 SseB family protein [Microbacterium sp. 4R-513]